MVEILKNFLISTALVLLLDWGGKFGIQQAWAISLRKRIPSTYSLLPPNKLIALVLLDAAGTNGISAGPPRSALDVNMVMFMLTFAIYGFCVWKPYRDEVLAQPDQ
jgi:hypothetical protein